VGKIGGRVRQGGGKGNQRRVWRMLAPETGKKKLKKAAVSPGSPADGWKKWRYGKEEKDQDPLRDGGSLRRGELTVPTGARSGRKSIKKNLRAALRKRVPVDRKLKKSDGKAFEDAMQIWRERERKASRKELKADQRIT